jgi:tetratricopeptide (TPR) repeat protein
LGTILYEALTARLPFDGPTTPEVLNAIVNKAPTPIAERNSRVPRALEMVVARLLEKNPGDRYQSAAEVAEDLRAIQQTGDLARRRATVSRRRLTIAAAVAAAALAVASGVAAGVVWWRTHRITVTAGRVQSLVVVPATISGPPQFQFLADAIPNSLTTQLAAHSGLTMKVPPTATEFSNVDGDLVRVTDSYGVSVCVVPRATIASGRLTINVQIVEPKRRDIVWSREFQSPIERYADAVVDAADGLALALTGKRPSSADPAASTTSAVALAIGRGEYYGRLFNARYQQSDYELAQSAYREALQTDPRSANAAAGLAYLEIFKMQGGAMPALVLPTLDVWAHRAIDSEPENPLGWAALAVAESWRTPADHVKQLEYGFRAASYGEGCGRCQLALMMGIQHLSAVLKYHIAVHDAELDPLSAYGHLNSAIALTTLGRSDEASAALVRAAAIEPDALWVSGLRTLVEAASGSLRAAVADADLLAARDRVKSMPPWTGRILDLIRAEAIGDAPAIDGAVARLREPAQHGRAVEEELMYLATIVAQVLARAGQTKAALAVLSDITAADAPPTYDMVALNPFMKPVFEDAQARPIVARSHERFDLLLKAIQEARNAGRFPRYLDQPLQDLLSTLRKSGRAD